MNTNHERYSPKSQNLNIQITRTDVKIIQMTKLAQTVSSSENKSMTTNLAYDLVLFIKTKPITSNNTFR